MAQVKDRPHDRRLNKRRSVRGGLSVNEYAKKLAQENRLAGGRPIRNLKSCAAQGLSLANCPRIDRKPEQP